MNIKNAFPSKWLKAEDLKGQQLILTVVNVTYEKVGVNGNKLIAHFAEISESLILNKTNTLQLAKFLGEDTDRWAAATVVLGTALVQYAGQAVNAIRVLQAVRPKLSTPDGAAQPAATPAADPKQVAAAQVTEQLKNPAPTANDEIAYYRSLV